MANLSSYINISANTISASGNITSSVLSGNGSALTSLTGNNVTGTVPAANVTVNAVMSLVSNNQEYRPVLATNTAGNLPFKGSAGISWNPSTYAFTAGRINLGSGIGGLGVTGTYAYGGNVSWAVQSQNGSGSDAQGQEIGRFGSEYNNGASTFWDSYVSYYQGSGSNSGWLIINAAGNAVANVTGQGILVTGYVSATGNVTGGNVRTVGLISATGNITTGNILTGGLISATGNIITSTNGFIGIGTATPDSELTILANPQTVTYPVTGNSTTTGTDLHISGADATQTRITQDAFGTGAYVAFTGRAARGNAAAPTATQSGDTIAQFTGRGFSSGNLQFGNASTGRVDLVAAENFTDTSRATNVQIFTTATNSITATAIAAFSSGGLSVAGNITGNTAGFTIGYLNIPQVAFAANATIALTDAGKHYYSTSTSNLALTIANNTSVSWPIGATITVIERAAGNIIITPGTGVSLYYAGNATAGSRVLSAYGLATLINVEANVWMVNGSGLT